MDVSDFLGAVISKFSKPPETTISAQETIPLERVWEDGIVRSKDADSAQSVYSKTIRFEDINYRLLDEEQRQKLLDSWGMVFNYFDRTAHLQLTCYCEYADTNDTKKMLPDRNDGLQEITNEFESFLQKQSSKSGHGMKLQRYLTFSVHADTIKSAKPRLNQMEKDLLLMLGEQHLDTSPHVLSGAERMDLLYRILHNGEVKEKQNSVLRGDVNSIAPSIFRFGNGKTFQMGKQVGAACFFRIQTTALGDGTLPQLLGTETDLVLTFHIDGIDRNQAIRKIKRKQTDVNQSKIEEQKKAVRGGYDIDIIPTDLNTYASDLDQMLKTIRSGSQHAFYMTMILLVTAANKEQLNEKLARIERISAQRDIFQTRLEYQQEEGLLSSLPLGVNSVSYRRMVTTSLLAGFVPFSSKELHHSGQEALYCGSDPISGNLIMIDRKQGNNPNGMIFGKPGSGKSFAAKMEIFHAFFGTEDDLMICDPEAEYHGMAEQLHGQIIRIAQNSSEHINPMDINPDYDDDEPLKLKSDFILSLCELIVGGKDGLRPIEKSAIDRCIQRIYAEYLADPKPENMPILEDLYNELCRLGTRESRYLADSMAMYIGDGSLNAFNQRTNVNIDNRMVVFDIKDLGKQSKKLGMLIVQDAVWNRVSANRRAKRYTRYYIDEIHLLLKDEQTAAYTIEIWKRFRKWGGIPTGITQNVTDLLASQEIENIFSNSEYLMMLSQGDGDREMLQEKLHISDAQMDYMTDRNPGEGLIKFGNTILPFENHFPRDSIMYTTMTTRLGESHES